MWLILVQAAEMSGTNLSIGTRLPMLGGELPAHFVPDTERCLLSNLKMLLIGYEWINTVTLMH